MADKIVEVFEKYDFTVNRTNKIRGGLLCDTDKGLFVINEYNGTSNRLLFEEKILSEIEKMGIISVDMIIRSKEEELSCRVTDGRTFVVRKWFSYRSMDTRNTRDVLIMARALGQLHNILVKITEETFCMVKDNRQYLGKEYIGYITQLKRIKKYISRKTSKQEYERMLGEEYDYFLPFAEQSCRLINEMENKYGASILYGSPKLCHGNYNYHNIGVVGEDIVIFECGMARIDYQIRDLYDFIRKTMEKNEWDMKLGHRIIETYSSICPMTSVDIGLLKAMLIFPYKYKKMMNFYYNSNKALCLEKNSDKLMKIRRQQNLKNKFIETI